MKITIKDVAERANVSPSTVSRVFTGVAKVSPDKREAVLKAADELSFTPNFMARSLKLNHSYTIGLLLPDISNPYYSQLARSAEMAAREYGYSLLLADSNDSLDRECTYLSWLVERRVDGIILATVGGSELHIEEARDKVPIVTVGRRLKASKVDSVFADNYQVGSLAAEHLIELGHSSFGIVAGNPNVSSTQMRIRGFIEYLEKCDHTIKEHNILFGTFSLESGSILAQEMFSANDNLPTALFCLNDQLAIGAIKALSELGYNVPDQVSVVGCDNTYIASIFQPELSTINRPVNDMGKIAVELLLERIEKDRKKTRHVELPVTLVRRASTALAL